MTMNYSVHIEARGPLNAAQVDLLLIEALYDHLAANESLESAVVSGGGDSPSYGATMDIAAPSMVSAAELAADAFTAAASAAGLPDWGLAAVEALDYDELERRNNTPLVPELVGRADALSLINEPDLPASFPDPVQIVNETALWTRSSVLGWLERQN